MNHGGSTLSVNTASQSRTGIFKTKTTWPAIQQDQQLVPLLLIRQLTHNFDKLEHGVMATINTDMELYLRFMRRDELVDDYLNIF